jgi:uncharacterized membrane protein
MAEIFAIFGYMVWIIGTFFAWIVGIGATLTGAADEDGELFFGGLVVLFLAMFSSSALLAQLN